MAAAPSATRASAMPPFPSSATRAATETIVLRCRQEFEEGCAAACRLCRNQDLGQDLIGLEQGFVIAGEKPLYRDNALAALRARDDLRIEGEESRRRIEVRIGLCHRAAKGCDGSYSHGRDMPAGFGQ